MEVCSVAMEMVEVQSNGRPRSRQVTETQDHRNRVAAIWLALNLKNPVTPETLCFWPGGRISGVILFTLTTRHVTHSLSNGSLIHLKCFYLCVCICVSSLKLFTRASAPQLRENYTFHARVSHQITSCKCSSCVSEADLEVQRRQQVYGQGQEQREFLIFLFCFHLCCLFLVPPSLFHSLGCLWMDGLKDAESNM